MRASVFSSFVVLESERDRHRPNQCAYWSVASRSSDALRGRAVTCAVLLALALGCAPRRVDLPPATPLRCLENPDPRVTWDRPAVDTRALNAWCATVGAPVVAGPPPVVDRVITRLAVVSWNVHVGGGAVDQVAALAQMRGGLGQETGLVLLLQEVFRAGADVGQAPLGAPVPQAIRPHRPTGDVVELARRLSLSAFYVPSMRNGRSDEPGEWEDRGTAILSTEPLGDLIAIELPLARQRRVAVMATVRPRNPAATPLRLVATHFDVVLWGGGAVRQAQHLAQRIQALNTSGLPLLIGADANAMTGFSHGTVKALDGVAPVARRCGTGRSSPWLARMDFIFTNVPDASVSSCETLDDRYGSDHRPIVLTVGYPPG